MSSDTAGYIAIGAAALAVLALLICIFLAGRLRRLRSSQKTIAGTNGDRTLVEHAGELDGRLSALAGEVERSIERIDGRAGELDRRLRGAITQCGVIRYDAMGEMTGRQSSSVALLDSQGNGVVLSSILHRESARLYAKPVEGGQSELELSPEEQQAVSAAMGSST